MIRILSPDVANRIAAGEVVERPASVVKELLENSLDAEATRVLIEIEEGGKRLIRVTDDGCGLTADDLALAFVAHATSKIASVEELFEVQSFGFRGEALASIGSVSRASILSRRADETLGHQVRCEGGSLSPVEKAGGPRGTVVEIRDLFFNTPARRKFLKSDGAEIARISEAVLRVLLGREDLALELKHNGRRVLRVDRAESFEARLLELFGQDLAGKLIPVRAEAEGICLDGFLAAPDAARGNAQRQYLLLNERFIRDRSLQHAVSRGYEGFLLPRRYPVWFLRLDMDPASVDVNVHPMKTEVRFREKNRLFALVQRACRTALEASRPSGTLHLKPEAPYRSPSSRSSSSSAAPATRRERVAEMEAGLFGSEPAPAQRPEVFDEPSTTTPMRGGASSAKKRSCRDGAWPRHVEDPESFRFVQMHDSYLVVEDALGFHVVDQHALHERMLFENLAQRMEKGEVASQELLIPWVRELSASEKQRVLAAEAELDAMGLRIRDFGGQAVAVEAVPLEFGDASPDGLIDAVLAADEERVEESFSSLRRRLLAAMACRAAVKFGQSLSDREIRVLLAWERESPQSAACPHGRPTRVRIGLEELERLFLRKD